MTGSLQIKSDKYYAVLNFRDQEGKRVQKWIPLNLMNTPPPDGHLNRPSQTP